MTPSYDDQVREDLVLLGMLIAQTDPAIVGSVAAKLRPDWAVRPQHEDMLKAIASAAVRVDRGDELSLPLIEAAFVSHNLPDAAESLRQIEDLLIDADVFSGRRAEIDAWVENLNRRADRRAVKTLLSTALSNLDNSLDTEVVTASLSTELMAHQMGSYADATAFNAMEMAQLAMDRRDDRARTGGVPELSSGSPDLDKALGVGTEPGKMTIIAARPGVGKTIAVCDMARGWLSQERGVIMFSLEMSAEDLWDRMMAAEAGVDHNAITNGTLTPAQDARLSGVEADRMSRWKDLLVVETDAAITAEQIAMRVQQQKLAWERAGIIPAGFIVDYIQQVRSSNPREEKRVTVEKAASLMTRTAKSTRMHCVLAAQLNREGDNGPEMANLKDSGQLEQDAENVILLNRPEMKDATVRPGEVDFIIGKTRKARPGVIVPRASLMAMQTFVDLAKESDRAAERARFGGGTSESAAPSAGNGHTGGWNAPASPRF